MLKGKSKEKKDLLPRNISLKKFSKREGKGSKRSSVISIKCIKWFLLPAKKEEENDECPAMWLENHPEFRISFAIIISLWCKENSLWVNAICSGKWFCMPPAVHNTPKCYVPKELGSFLYTLSLDRKTINEIFRTGSESSKIDWVDYVGSFS